jgi:hypothetical protein
MSAPDGPEAAPMTDSQLTRDVAWLRKEAGHVDVENDFGDQDRPAGDGLRGIAQRIEALQEQLTALRRALAALEAELLDDVCEGDVAMQAKLAQYAERVAAILAQYPAP